VGYGRDSGEEGLPGVRELGDGEKKKAMKAPIRLKKKDQPVLGVEKKKPYTWIK